MRNHLEIIFRAKNVRVQAARIGDDFPQIFDSPSPFNNPLSKQDCEEARRFLQKYLGLPYIISGSDRWFQAHVQKSGERLFNEIFGVNKPGRAAYRALNSSNFRLIISADTAELLEIPWEILKDPDTPVMLGFRIEKLERQKLMV